MAGNADPMLPPASMGDFFDDAFFSELTTSPPANSVYAGSKHTTFWDPCAHHSTINSDESDGFALKDGCFSALPESAVSELDCTNTGIAAQDAELKRVTELRKATSSDSKHTGARDSKKSTRKRQNEIADTSEFCAKRETNRKKNRTAASRCRVKRRNWTSKLEDSHRGLSAQNELLRSEAASLNDIIFELKERVLEHADCKFRLIDDYVRLGAEKAGAKARQSAATTSSSASTCITSSQLP